MTDNNVPIGKILLGVFAALFLLTGFLGFFTVDQGEVSVVTRAGQYKEVVGPGFNFKMPFIDGATDFEIRTQKYDVEKVVSYSRDIQQSTSRIVVNYDLPAANVERVFKQLGKDYAARVLYPAVLDKYKEVFGQYTAAEIVADRNKVGIDVTRAIREEVLPHGINVTAVQIVNIDFTKEFEHAIEAAVKAKAQVTEAEQILRRKEVEAKTVVVQAEAAAEAARKEAAGKADALILTSSAEAKAHEIVGKAIAANPVIVEMKKAERWDGKLPTSMPPGSSVPFIQVK
jgi:regulator of protease activity HflC (stomatin/prohibitin superfamily)